MFFIIGLLLSGLLGLAGAYFIGWWTLPFIIIMSGFIGVGAVALDNL